MNITLKKLERWDACKGGLEWLKNNDIKSIDSIELINKLVADNQYKHAFWLIPQLLTIKQNKKWSIFSAELALPVFEKAFPDNNIPREAIDAAKSGEDCSACANASTCAANAAYCGSAASDAADAAAYAAHAAAASADSVCASDAAYAAAYAAYAADASADSVCAAHAACSARNAYDADKTTGIKIINYGLELMNSNDTEE